MSTLQNILVWAFVGSVAGLVGDLTFLISKKWADLVSHYAIPFAAGVLLSVTFLDLLPEAIELGGEFSYQLILAIYVVLFLFEHFVFHLHHHSEKDRPKHGSVYYVIFGDTIHNFLDGVAIASSFMINPGVGVLVSVSTFLHEVPHEIADFAILLSAGWSRKKALFVNLVSALATFIGALVAYFVVSSTAILTTFFLSLAAGLFLYVATTDFLPAVARNHKQSWKFIFTFMLGIFIIFISGMILPEMR